MALLVFQQARGALEVTRGTDLTPTRIIYAESIEWDNEVRTIAPVERRNSYFPIYAAAAGVELNRVRMTGRMSFDDLVWWLSLFVKGGVSGSGGGADKTWTFVPSAATDDVKSLTLQLAEADTIGTAPGVKLNYLMGETLNIHWEKNDDGAVTFEGSFLGAKAATQITAFTGSLSDRTVQPMSANGTTAWVDLTTIGTTADPEITAIDWTLNLNPVAFYSLDGTTAARAVYRPQHRFWTASVTRRYDTSTQWTAYSAKSLRKVRVKTTGIALGASNYSAQLDMYGQWDTRSKSDIDGIVTEVLGMTQRYDSTATTDFGWVVVNADTAVT